MERILIIPFIIIISYSSLYAQNKSYCEWNNITVRNVIIGEDDSIQKKFEELVQNVIDDDEFSCTYISNKFKGSKYQILTDFNKNARKKEFEKEKRLSPQLEHFLFLSYSHIGNNRIRVNGYLHDLYHVEVLEQIDINLSFTSLKLSEQKIIIKRFLNDFRRTIVKNPYVELNKEICSIYVSGFDLSDKRCISNNTTPEILLKNFIDNKFDAPSSTANVTVATEFKSYETEKPITKSKGIDIIICSKEVILDCNDVNSSKTQYFYEVLQDYNNKYIPSSIVISNRNSLKLLNSDFINFDLKKTVLWISYEKQLALKNISRAKSFLKSILELSTDKEEQSDIYYLLLEHTLKNYVSNRELEECQNYYKKFININGESDYRRRIKWLQTLMALNLDRKAREFADKMIKKEYNEIFYSDKIPTTFPSDELSFLFVFSLSNKYNRKELANQIVKNYMNNQSFNFLINAIKHYENVENETQMLTLIEQFNTLYPYRSEGYELLAKYYEERDNPDKVFINAKNIFKRDGLNSINNLRLSNIYFRRNQIDSAYMFCSLAKTIDPNVICQFDKFLSKEPCCYSEDFSVRNEFDGKTSKFHVVNASENLFAITRLRQGKFPSITLDDLCKKNGIRENSTIFPGQKIYIHIGCDIQFMPSNYEIGIREVINKLSLTESFKNKTRSDIYEELVKFNFGSNKEYVSSLRKKVWFYKSRCKIIR